MPVNKDELVKDLATPEYQTLAKTELAKAGLEVLDKPAKDKLLEDHEKEVIEKKIPVEIEKVHTKYDKDFADIFPGYKREANEKTYDAIKRVGKAEVEKFTGEITKLKDEIKKGDPTGALKKQLEETEERAKNEIAKRDKEIETLKGGQETATKSIEFGKIYGGVKSTFMSALPPMFKQLEESVNAKLLGAAVMKDGKLYQGNGDGTIKKHPTTFKEITIEEALGEEYKDVIDVRKKQGGAGSGGPGKKDTDKIDPKEITPESYVKPETIKTQTDLMTHLMELGLSRGTKEFNAIYNKHRAGLPLQ